MDMELATKTSGVIILNIGPVTQGLVISIPDRDRNELVHLHAFVNGNHASEKAANRTSDLWINQNNFIQGTQRLLIIASLVHAPDGAIRTLVGADVLELKNVATGNNQHHTITPSHEASDYFILDITVP